jgi:uncharacterized Tic20 family protein
MTDNEATRFPADKSPAGPVNPEDNQWMPEPASILPDEPLLAAEPDFLSPVETTPIEAAPVEVQEDLGIPLPVPETEAAIPPAPPPPATSIPGDSINPTSEERTWAMLAHLSILLNLITGFLGPLAAVIIYLVYKEKSRYVAYQSLQAFVFQLIWWVGAGIVITFMWIFVGLLSAVVIGLCLIPFALIVSLIPIAALVYGVIAGLEANQGRDFRYWLIGNWLRNTLTGN